MECTALNSCGLHSSACCIRFRCKEIGYDYNGASNTSENAAINAMRVVSAAYELGNSVCASVCLRSYCIVPTADQKGQRFEKVKSNFKAPWD